MKRLGTIFMAAVVMIMLCSCGNYVIGQDGKSADNNGQAEIKLEEADMNNAEGNDTENPDAVSLPEEFVLVQGGTRVPDSNL